MCRRVDFPPISWPGALIVIFSAMTHELRGVRVDENAYYVKTLRPNVCLKHEYHVKLWRHKQRTRNTNDCHMPLNETLPMKIFCVRHWVIVIFPQLILFAHTVASFCTWISLKLHLRRWQRWGNQHATVLLRNDQSRASRLVLRYDVLQTGFSCF